MLNRIRRIIAGNHRLWMVDGELQPATYVAYLLAQRYSPADAKRIRGNMIPLAVDHVALPIVAMIHRGLIHGYRVATWAGPRYGSAVDVRRFLRREGWTAAELKVLFSICPRERLARVRPLRALLARGITA